MKKRLPLILLTVCLVIAAVFTFGGCITDGFVEQPDYGYTAKEIKVTAEVQTDRSVNVTETIHMYYSQQSHGFYRDLPINSGEKYRDVRVEGDDFKILHETSSMLSIKIGSEYTTYFKESKSYIIKYTIIPPKMEDDYQSVYFNIIGSGFNMVREKVDMTITFPTAPVAETKFVVGKFGSDTDGKTALDITTENDGKTVRATLKGDTQLRPYEGITFIADFEKGTFKTPIDAEFLITLLTGLALIAAVIVVKLFYGKNEQVVPIVNFYPPEVKGKQMSPAQMGCIIDNSCSPEDVTSLIFYWASLGCINLEEDKNKRDMILYYIKPLPDNSPAYEKKMFNKLFAKGETINTSSLKDSFYTTMSYVQSEVKAQYSGKLFDTKHSVISYVMLALIAIYAAATVFFAYFRISPTVFNFFGLLVIVPLLVLNFFGLYIAHNYFKIEKSARTKYFVLYGIAAAALAVVCLFFVTSDAMGLLEKIVLGVCTAVSVLFVPFINIRTKFYNENLNNIIGFRDFIKLAEKSKLEMLLEQDPQYFYNILPYANVLGVSQLWQDKFKNLTMQPPTYYRSNVTVFDFIVFNHFMRRASSNFRSVAVSRPSQSSSSGGGGGWSSGGGGSVGGGFGGGGSRRW